MNAHTDSAEWLRENAEQVEALADSDHDFAAAARVLLAIQREEDPDPDDLAETRETVKPFIDTDGTAAREQYVRAPAAGRDCEVSPGEHRAFAAAVRDALRREERAERAPVDVQMRVETRENADGDPVEVTVWEVVE